MDKKQKTDSKSTVTAAELKLRLKQSLDSEAERDKVETEKLKSAVKSEDSSSEFDFKLAENTLENLNVEDLIAKYMPPEDVKFAERISLSDVKVDAEDNIKIEPEAVEEDNIDKADENKEENGSVSLRGKTTELYGDGNVNAKFVKENELALEEDGLSDENGSNELGADKQEQVELNADDKKDAIDDGFDAEEIKQILSLGEDEKEEKAQKTKRPLRKAPKIKPIKKTDKEKISEDNTGETALTVAEDANLTAEKDGSDKKEEIDDTDIKLMYAFGMDDELEKTVGKEGVDNLTSTIESNIVRDKEKEKSNADEEKITEFTSIAQIKQIFSDYKAKYNRVLIKLLGGLILLLLSGLLENLPQDALPDVINSNKFAFIHIMTDLQLILIGSAMIWPMLLKGIKAIAEFKPIPESVTVLTIIISLIYEIIACFIGTPMKMYGFAVLFAIFLTEMFEYMNLKREIFSFNITASKRIKYAITRIPEEKAGLEAEAFAESLPESPELFKIGRAKFIDGYFRRIQSGRKDKPLLKVLLPLTVAISIVFFAAAAIVTKNAFTGLAQAYVTLMVMMPISVFVTYSYPFYAASKEAYGVESAILGDDSLEEYSKANAVSFEDKDVFPSYGVKVRSVKVYGQNRIDFVIYNAASVFMKINGPLSDVFEVATQDLGHSSDVEIVEVDNSGIEAVVDGTHIYIGKAQYIHSKGFMLPRDRDAETEEGTGEVAIMYMTLGDDLAAKMYVQYVIDPDFEQVVKQLTKIGVSVGIKTLDPNISDQMLSTRIKISKYPVKVLKIKSTDDVPELNERIDSGIISKGSAKSLLQTLALCDRVISATKNEVIVKIFAVAVGVIISAIILALGMSAAVSSFLVVLYHVFWLVPIILIARVCVGKI